MCIFIRLAFLRNDTKRMNWKCGQSQSPRYISAPKDILLFGAKLGEYSSLEMGNVKKLKVLCAFKISEQFSLPQSQSQWERTKYARILRKLSVSDNMLGLVLFFIFGKTLDDI